MNFLFINEPWKMSHGFHRNMKQHKSFQHQEEEEEEMFL